MTWSRRRLLQQVGLSALASQLLPPLSVRAQGALPKRLIIMATSNGTIHEQWLPAMNGTTLQLSPILQPLLPYRDRLLVVDGLDYTVAIQKGRKDGHFGGANGALTGMSNVIIDPNDPAEHSLALGPSIDQVIGARIGASLPFRSLQLGIKVEDYSPTCTYSFSGPRQAVMAENSPYVTWDRVFGRFMPSGAPDPAVEREKSRQRSLLDFHVKELRRLERGLGPDDRSRLGAHLSSIRELEQRLGAPRSAAALDACVKPARGQTLDFDPYSTSSTIPALCELNRRMAVMALACDLSRVVLLQYGRPGAQHRFSWLGPEFNSDPDNGPNDSTAGIHGLAHNESNPASRAKLVRCHAWYATEMKALLDALAGIREGEGTMLDNTLVVWMNEMGTGSHDLTKTPWVLAGNVGGFFRTGRLVRSPGPHNRLLASIDQAFGATSGVFGDRDFCPGPLAGLTA
jgi:hypothetical protein